MKPAAKAQGWTTPGLFFCADGEPVRTLIERIQPVEPYQLGQFYRRELPCLLAALARVAEPLAAVVIDGYVWVKDGQPALGAHRQSSPGAAA